MSTQTAVEQKTTQYPAEKPGGGDPVGGPVPGPEQPEGAVQRLKSERIQEELKAMTGWSAVERDTAVENVQTFATPGIAGLYGAFALQSAAASGYQVTVCLAGNQVCVTVFAQQIDGCPSEVDLPVLAFARQLS